MKNIVDYRDDKYSSAGYVQIEPGIYEAGKECYLEFCSDELEDIRRLRSIIGKHVYCKNVVDAGEEFVELVIE